MELAGGVVFLGLLGLVPALIAWKKGRQFGPWWAFGTILFLPALIIALVLKPADTEPVWGRWGLLRSPWHALPNIAIFGAINVLAVTSHNSAFETVAIMAGCGLLYVVLKNVTANRP